MINLVPPVPIGKGTNKGTKVPDEVIAGLIKKHGARVHPQLVREGWVDLEELYGWGWVELDEDLEPGPGAYMPARNGWVKCE